LAACQSGHCFLGEIFPFFGLAQPGPARFGMQYRLLPADRAKRAVVPDVLCRRRPRRCFHDRFTPLRRITIADNWQRFLLGRDFVPAAFVSQQQLLRTRLFRTVLSAGGAVSRTVLLSWSSGLPCRKTPDWFHFSEIRTGRNEAPLASFCSHGAVFSQHFVRQRGPACGCLCRNKPGLGA